MEGGWPRVHVVRAKDWWGAGPRQGRVLSAVNILLRDFTQDNLVLNTRLNIKSRTSPNIIKSNL